MIEVESELLPPELQAGFTKAFPMESKFQYDPDVFAFEMLDKFIKEYTHRLKSIWEWTARTGREALFGCGMKKGKFYANTVRGATGTVRRKLAEEQVPIFDIHTHPTYPPAGLANFQQALEEFRARTGRDMGDPEFMYYPSPQDYLQATGHGSGAGGVIMPSGRLILYAVMDEEKLYAMAMDFYKQVGMEEAFGPATPFEALLKITAYPNTAVDFMWLTTQVKCVQTMGEYDLRKMKGK